MKKVINSYTQAFAHRLSGRANAWAAIRGGQEYPRLLGTVKFFQTQAGVLVLAEIHNLPYEQGPCENSVFGFHIHEGRSCDGMTQEDFSAAEGHFNPDGCPHPAHAGDLPPLFANHGYAWSAFLTSRFTIRQVLGRTLIIHGSPDDFTTQPAGNSGKRIACGEIR